MEGDPIRLDIGGTFRFKVLGKERWNMSGLKVARGERYKLAVFGQTKNWRDATVESTPEGHINVPPLLQNEFVQKLRRFQGAEWYALTGCVRGNRDWFFKIGNGTVIDMEISGELGAFANDAWLMYWNNHGSLDLDVERCRL